MYPIVAHPTGIEDPGELPGGFDLNQNFPNPFSFTTQFTFEVKEESSVRVTITNLSGKEIVTLVNAVLAQGSHQVTWDVKDDAGHSVGSGTYLYRVSSSTSMQSKKLILIR